MTIFLKLLKWAGFLALGGAVLLAGLFGWTHYDDWQREQAKLTYGSKHQWKWHNRYYDIQISHSEVMGRSMLRKVDQSNKYIVEAWKNDDYSTNAVVKFITDCEPRSQIDTGKKFTDGQPKVLVCDQKGRYLSLAVSWPGNSTEYRWSENFGGFSFEVDFRDWDFSKLDQEVTLSRAKRIPSKKSPFEGLSLKDLEVEAESQQPGLSDLPDSTKY